jgi:mannosyltransferase
LTAWRYDDKPMWRDEYFTYGTVNRDLPGMLSILDGPDIGLAGYYSLMHLWMLLSDSTWWLRAPGALATVATAGLVALLGRRLGGMAVGVASGLLICVMPAVVTHAQEARAYPFVLLATTATALCLLRHLDVPTTRTRGVLAVVAVLPGLIHPLPGLPAVAGMFAGALLAPGQERRPLLVLTAIPAAVVGCGLVVAGYLQQGDVDPGPKTGLTGLISFHQNFAATRPFSALLALLALVGLVRVARSRGPWLVLVGWCAAPVVVIGGLGLAGSYFRFRYVASITSAVVVLVAVGVVVLAAFAARAARLQDRPVLAHGLTAAGIVVLLVPLGADALRFRATPFYADDTRAAVEQFASRYRQGDAVVFSGLVGRGSTEFYLPPGTSIDDTLLLEAPVPSGTLAGVEVAASRRAAVLEDRDRVWVVGTVSRGDWSSAALGEEVAADRVLQERYDRGLFVYELWSRGG